MGYQREELRKAMLERRFVEVERTLATLEANWWQSADWPGISLITCVPFL